MSRRTKIVATVGPQRTEADENRTDELRPFVEGAIPHGQLLARFIGAGADLIRLNMSFASFQDEYGFNESKYLAWLDEHKRDEADQVAVLGDLPGPKIRLGTVVLGDRELLKHGEDFFLSFGGQPVEEPGASVLVNDVPFDEAVRGVNGAQNFSEYVKGSKDPVLLSIGDGRVELHAIETTRGAGVVRCQITSDLARASDVARGKGLTIRHASVDVSAFQQADQQALNFLLERGGELLAFVAVSFAQSRDDILVVKHHIENHKVIQSYLQGQRQINSLANARVVSPGVIAKIETRKGWDNIDEILDVADGVMVARGDLGEQIPVEEVPEVQKDLIRLCNARGKVVITATQMLDSMEKKPVPTRAEATDVFNAILDGTDAVMLSGETALGSHPIRSIRTMVQIAERAERYYFIPTHRRPFEQIVSASASLIEEITKRLAKMEEAAADLAKRPPAEARAYYSWVAGLYREKRLRSEKQPTTDLICEAACLLSEAHREERGAGPAAPQSASWIPKPIVVPTTSGRTASMISRLRPLGCIIGAAHYERTYRKLLLGFGIRPVRIGARQTDSQQTIRDAAREAISADLLKEGDEFVTTAGTPLYVPGTTNLIQLLEVPKPENDEPRENA